MSCDKLYLKVKHFTQSHICRSCDQRGEDCPYLLNIEDCPKFKEWVRDKEEDSDG